METYQSCGLMLNDDTDPKHGAGDDDDKGQEKYLNYKIAIISKYRRSWNQRKTIGFKVGTSRHSWQYGEPVPTSKTDGKNFRIVPYDQDPAGTRLENTIIKI